MAPTTSRRGISSVDRDDTDATAPQLSAAIDHIVSLPGELQPRTGKHSALDHTSLDKRREQQNAVCEEFGEKITQVNRDWAAQLYSDLATDEQILAYLRHPASGYDTKKGQWSSLSLRPKSKAALRTAMTGIVSSILHHFHPSPSLPPGVSRSAVDSHDTLLQHDNGKHASCPSISIRAEGPSFEIPRNSEKGSAGLGYTNVAGVIDARLDKEKGGSAEQAAQFSISCRQIFFQQPNRHFARSLMIPEKEVHMAHYDRSGAYVTPLYNIHKDKELFVRLILGLVSPNEEVLGLDTSVQWVIDGVTGRKVSGTVEVDEWDDEQKTSTVVKYDLDMNEPPIVRPTIRGRGTVGWRATHPTTNEAVFIKDSWRAGERESEVDLLRTARGTPGVVEILAYQDYCAETRAFRPESFEEGDFTNRVELRVVLKRYGTSIWYFKTQLELLRALRDAIVGHRELYRRGVLHRDVSMQNILFGLPGAPEGRRGCLIDLDVAVRTENGVSPIPMTSENGTHLYQSILVLRSDTADFPVPQDYMDDLEGFFYVLCHLVFLFSKPGVTLPDPPEMLVDWTKKADNFITSTLKAGSLGPDFPIDEIPAFWGDAVRVLVDTFRTLVLEVFYRKARIAKGRALDRMGRVRALAAVSWDTDVYFGKVKEAFDTAILGLEEEGLGPDERELDFAIGPQATTTPSSVSSPVGAGPCGPTTAQVVSQSLPAKKRALEEGQAHGTPHKRRRNAATETAVEDGIMRRGVIDALF